jgi:hypothetical protein
MWGDSKWDVVGVTVVPPIRGGFWCLSSNEDEDGDVSSPSVVIVGASSIGNRP